MNTASFLLPLVALTGLASAAPSLYPGDFPGKARVSTSNSEALIGNKLFTAKYQKQGDSVVFGGLKTADGTLLLEPDTPLFSLRMQDGRIIRADDMKLSGLRTTKLKSQKNATRASEGLPGQSVSGTFTAPDGSFSVDWSAVLRNGSHYLRQELTITANSDVSIREIAALDVMATPKVGSLSVSGNTTHGRVVAGEKLFFGLETPMSLMTAGADGLESAAEWTPLAWQTDSFGAAFNLPDSFRKAYGDRYAASEGPVLAQLKVAEGPVSFAQGGNCTLTFRYSGGNHKLNLVGVQLVDAAGHVVSEDVHEGSTGHASSNNTYRINVPQPGDYRLRYWVQTRTESIHSKGNVSVSLPLAEKKDNKPHAADGHVRGVWQRKAPLAAGKSWKVSSVIGFFQPQQQRRSFLTYVERERAVPYRPFVHYNDWYEIGITLHDYVDPKKRTSEAMWLDVLDTWQEELCNKRKVKLDGFVVDDGWDEFNSLWDFHCGFPDGFSKLAQKAARQGAGVGTWLGPVGGYGASKGMRLNHWNNTHPQHKIHNFQLSNEEYFNAFVGRCTQMIKDYNMNYFKFDGISTHFHAKGPADIEDAEGILNVIAALRETRPDVFINATVGTWASPFWYFHADSVWRQENDYGESGNAGDNRDRWITYRDRLVHEVFVKGAPLFPINSLMTHGTIITKNGPPRVMSRDPENCRKEIRMAFGSGSALQEIYADRDLLSQQGGLLWDELAACISWVRRNSDVLPDVHWVGGNPWNGQDGDIYGYAAWNSRKATLTLRNSSAREKTLTTTLRHILDVPPGQDCRIIFRNSFDDQRDLPGLTGKAVDADKTITITMHPFEVIVLEGKCDTDEK